MKIILIIIGCIGLNIINIYIMIEILIKGCIINSFNNILNKKYNFIIIKISNFYKYKIKNNNLLNNNNIKYSNILLFNLTENDILWINDIFAYILLTLVWFICTYVCLKDIKSLKWFKYVKRITLILFILYHIFYYYIYIANMDIYIDIINYAIDNNNNDIINDINNNTNNKLNYESKPNNYSAALDINSNGVEVQGSISGNKEAYEFINNTMSIFKSVGTSIGYGVGTGTAIAGVSASMSKVISNTKLPPVVKIGTIAAGVIGTEKIMSMHHKGTDVFNAFSENSSNKKLVNLICKSLSNSGEKNPINDINLFALKEFLEILLSIIELELLILYFLVIIILYKFILKNDKPELKFLNKIFKIEKADKIRFYLHKYMFFNKKIGNIYLYINLFTLFFLSCSLIYIISMLIDNLDIYLENLNN